MSKDDDRHLVDCLYDLSKSQSEPRTARMLRKAARRLEESLGCGGEECVPLWEPSYPVAIIKGETRLYKGREFVATRDIPVGAHTNAPNYSGLWEEATAALYTTTSQP